MVGTLNEDENGPVTNALPLGSTVGNYRIIRQIGSGGMGTVYLAEHPLIGKQVALKVLHPEFSSNEAVVHRFFNEAKAVNDIQHPNIVDIIDYGAMEDANGKHVYFIMEYLNGRSLRQILDDGPILPERCLQICIQVADALAASHRAGIIHRDLKPDNIMVVETRGVADFVKLVDFGIAKLTTEQASGSHRTRTGVVMGTPSYMSPEQCEGKGEIDSRTDIYALGVVLYQMIAGRTPFAGEGYGEILVQHLTQTPPPPSSSRAIVAPHVEAVCLRALEKNPALRYQTMEDFQAAMLDPFGIVEANGGLAGFHSPHLGAPVATHSQIHSAGIHYTPPPSSGKLPILLGLGILGVAGIATVLALGRDTPSQAAVQAVVPRPTRQQPVNETPTATPVAAPAKKQSAVPKIIPVHTSLVSQPAAAEIYIGEAFHGRTPARLSFDSDELPVVLTLRKGGYEDTQIIWNFVPTQKKQRYSFTAKLTARPKPAVANVRTTSAKAVSKRKRVSRPAKSKKSRTKLGDDGLAPTF